MPTCQQAAQQQHWEQQEEAGKEHSTPQGSQ